jgi:hypothetical protein
VDDLLTEKADLEEAERIEKGRLTREEVSEVND